jgi:ubiquinone/menaquinone biosynthesis C-methylase UbiE
MFTESARYYDAIYSFKDYRRESEILLELLAGKKGGTLLDVACGTGKHLEYLRENFSCEGLDLDEKLLAIAAQRLPGVPLHKGDMANFDLGKQFDAVTCLFSAIGCMQTVSQLHSAIRCFAQHAKPGGLVIVEPWFAPDQWILGHLHALFVDEPDLKIARMSKPERDGDVSVINFEYLISTRDGIERASEVHRMGLFTKDQYLAAFREAGLEVECLEGGLMGRGLYRGRRAN